MIPSLSAKQQAFYTKNGHLELEELLTPEECEKLLAAIRHTLAARTGADATVEKLLVQGRDLWRDAPSLRTFLLSPAITALAHCLAPRSPLRLACDQWFPAGYHLAQPTKLKDLFSIQGLFAALFLQLESPLPLPAKTSPLGILPAPQTLGSALLVQPQILLDWPPCPTGLYLIAFANTSAVYVHNSRDPAGHRLKALGYGYGDRLTNATHPLLYRT